MNEPAPLTIGLLWHSATSDNLGIGALTLSQIAIVEAVARRLEISVRFVILGWKDPRPGYVSAANVSRFEMRMKDMVSPRGLLAEVKQCDLVLDIGAGDSFADIYGAGRIWRMLLGKALVHTTGRPMILSPQTIGPFKRSWARRGALASIRHCQAVFTRDTLSSDFLRAIGYRGPIGEATDVALRLPYDRPPPRGGGPVRVGINVSGLLMSGGYSGRNMFGLIVDYPMLMRDVVARFAAMPEVEVHLIGHVISDQPIEDDHRAAEMIAAEAPGVRVAPKFASPSEAKTYIASMDFFAGSRMHACIAAFSAGVPVIPIAYSRKFAGLFGTLGYAHTTDCTREDQATIVAKIMDGFHHRDTLREETVAAFERGLDRLSSYESVLHNTLRSLRRS